MSAGHAKTSTEREKMSAEHEKEKYIFFFPHHYPLALAVNKSPAVYILSRVLDRLWREK